MSRLDSVIRRLQAQRLCLDWAIKQLSGYPGVVFELGLGNGRTFDHLRQYLPERQIYVFDRQVAAHPACIPESHFLYLGELEQTLPQAAAQHRGRCVLVHCDIGSGVASEDRQRAMMIVKTLPLALADQALVVSDQELLLPHSQPLSLPEGVAPGRYFIRRFHN